MEEVKKAAIAELLANAGLDSRDLVITPLPGGGNNRVFSAQCHAGTFLAKAYFRSPSDKRDRLGAEFSFLSYAWGGGLRTIPKPIGHYQEENLGLYEFIAGKKIIPAELKPEHIKQAARFFCRLNDPLENGRDFTLPHASEACFSLEQHFSLVDLRLQRLCALPPLSPTHKEFHAFLAEMGSAWQKIKTEITASPVQLHQEVRKEDRCISPSDFGFHNALLRESGEMCFIDFEYAGWDDPAKMIGDFFSQPAIPVALEYFDAFVSEALDYSENKDELTTRARSLLPVFGMKWCCIMLNEFLPEAAKRRNFANPGMELEQSRAIQLQKARNFFEKRII